jgi:hypothetical protein
MDIPSTDKDKIAIIPLDGQSPEVEELRQSLLNGPIIEYDGKELHLLTEDTIDHVDRFGIAIFADEHPPPHFHVVFNST